MNDGTSRAFAQERCLNTCTAFALQRPPVSMASTTSFRNPQVVGSCCPSRASLPHNSVPVCMWLGFTLCDQHPAKSDIDCQLSSCTTRKVLGENFDSPGVLSCHVHVHQDARWLPSESRRAWQPSHRASVTCNGNCSLSSKRVLNRCGGMVYSGAVGQCARAAPALNPE